jgi:hypothetical protein
MGGIGDFFGGFSQGLAHGFQEAQKMGLQRRKLDIEETKVKSDINIAEDQMKIAWKDLGLREDQIGVLVEETNQRMLFKGVEFDEMKATHEARVSALTAQFGASRAKDVVAMESAAELGHLALQSARNNNDKQRQDIALGIIQQNSVRLADRIKLMDVAQRGAQIGLDSRRVAVAERELGLRQTMQSTAKADADRNYKIELANLATGWILKAQEARRLAEHDRMNVLLSIRKIVADVGLDTAGAQLAIAVSKDVSEKGKSESAEAIREAYSKILPSIGLNALEMSALASGMDLSSARDAVEHVISPIETVLRMTQDVMSGKDVDPLEMIKTLNEEQARSEAAVKAQRERLQASDVYFQRLLAEAQSGQHMGGLSSPFAGLIERDDKLTSQQKLLIFSALKETRQATEKKTLKRKADAKDQEQINDAKRRHRLTMRPTGI